MVKAMSDSFLSRWSKRKLEARTNQQLEEKAASSPDSKPLLDREISVDQKIAVNSVDDAPPKGQTVSEPDLPLPTEADLVAVEQGGDIKAFMVEKVSTELKNKAFKALFSRPEFNVMDGLDIYIDDYNKFTPLSQEDIGKMALSKQLLSRPDLEILKKSEIGDGLERVGAVLSETSDSESSVLDKVEEDEHSEARDLVPGNEARVIPDGQQDADYKEESEKRLIESPDKK
ncbi:DUF3306 domain-containing protein [Limnobacter sp.]|uniref:DUF3306 domain-containing protein n=1 Tax=Limnobacter sp. TaxID=2003368 RepID=UPI0031204D90